MKLCLPICLLFVATAVARPDPKNPRFPQKAKSIEAINQSFRQQGWPKRFTSTLRYQEPPDGDVFFIWNRPFDGRAANLIFGYAYDGTQWRLFYHDTLESAFLSVQAAQWDELTGQTKIIVRGADGNVLATLPPTSWYFRPQR